MWSDVKIVHGKPRHSQSQGSVERASQDIENMLSTWMETNQISKWSEGLKFIQAMKNRAYHEEIKCSPYEAMFGCLIKMGIATSTIPRDIIGVIRSKEDLENLLQLQKNAEQNNDVENVIKQDREHNNVEKESQKGLFIYTAKNKIQEEISTEKVKGNKINDISNVTTEDNIASECNTNSETESTSQSQEVLVTIESIPKKIESVLTEGNKAKLSLEKQAEKMKDTLADKYSNVRIGQNVTLKVPEIDKAKTDPKTLLQFLQCCNK
ncbi:unnamed protein product [Parnassius mnemosyne]|uniref:Integrase catalytic domain-containing protein n=1 Tax=Parnassius mnemosyne TaxID=213953 RepID=A0AAV1KKG0_9NEOP